MEGSANRQRESWIDALRGAAVFLVVFGHVYAGNPAVSRAISPLKMPMFYILSGYVMHYDRGLKPFAKSLALRLLVPMLLFSLFPLYVLKYAAARDVGRLGDYLLRFLTGREVWFVPSFLASQTLMWILHRIAWERKYVLAALSVGCFCLGLLTSGKPLFNLWCLNTAFTGVLFLAMGKGLRSIPEKLLSDKKTILFGAAGYVLLMLLNLYLFPGGIADFHNVRYDSVLLFLGEVMTGTAACIGLAKWIYRVQRRQLLPLLGRYTLTVYLFHGFVYPRISALFDVNNIPSAVLVSLLTCTVGVMISVVAEKYAPWTIGIIKKS